MPFRMFDENNRHGRNPIITIISLSEEDLKADDHKATHNGRSNYNSRPSVMHHSENKNKDVNDDGGRNSDPGLSMIRPPRADNRNSSAHRITSHEGRYNQYRGPGAFSFNSRMVAHYEYRRYNNGPRRFMAAHPGIYHWHHTNNHHMANYGARFRYGSGNMTSPPSAAYRNANGHGGFNHEGGRRYYGQGRSMIYPLGANNQGTSNRMMGYNENRRIYNSRSSKFRPDVNDVNTDGSNRTTNSEDRRIYSSRSSTSRPDANDENTDSYKTTNFEDGHNYGSQSSPGHPPDANCTLNGLENGHGCSPIITIISLSEADLMFDNRKATNNESRHGNSPEPSAAPVETNNHTVSRHEETHRHGPGHLVNGSPGADDDNTGSYGGVDNRKSIDCSTFEPFKLDRNMLEQDIDRKLSSLKHVVGTGGPLFTSRQYLTFFQSD
ncbi:hypothetical protein BGX34_005654 [Mortierella sp. NVP85]|nr:hypothetical protein BGX34_005654 [Mortierella sp. NVP85]